MADLTTLAAVKLWLGIPTGTTNDDALLSTLITNCSDDFLNAINRPNFYPAANYTEVRNGNGTSSLMMKEWPINSVSSVTVDTISIQASPDGVQPGFTFDKSGNPEGQNTVYLVGGAQGFMIGNSGLQPTFAGASIFTQGFNNVTVVYNAGYAAIPPGVNQAVVEWVSYRYRQRQWIGQVSKHMQMGETITFQNVAMPLQVASVVKRYLRRVPIL